MTTLREAAQMALDALEHLQTDIEWQYKSPTRAMLRKVEKALRAALAQPPCATGSQCVGNKCELCAVQEREWVGLTDEELLDIADMAYANDLELLQTLQAKLKEKNT